MTDRTDAQTRKNPTMATTSVHETRTDCPARYHDTYSAYQRGHCRCPKARDEHRLYQKRGREGRRAPKLIDATGTQRRIHALMALGHSTATIGNHCGMSRFEIQQIASNRRYVMRDTATAIAGAYDKLSGTAGTSGITRARARNAGYAPPLAWDDNTIDNPAAKPDFGSRSSKHGVDPVAVARVAAGEMRFGRLATAEQVELYRRHRGDRTITTLSRTWGVSGARIRQIAELAEVA